MNRLAFILAIIAILVALANFIYKIVRFHKTDYATLLIVVVVGILVASISYRKGNENSAPGKTSVDNGSSGGTK
jgi:hypothetical protein